MFVVILTISAIFGAVVAFRRNPSYTGRSLLRIIPAYLLSVTAMVALIIAAVHFTIGRSTAVVFATMTVVILFSSLLLIYVLITVGTPKDARLTGKLPPGTKLVSVHRRRIIPWLKVLAIAVLVCGILGLVIPGNARYIGLTLGGLILFISAILLPVFYFVSRRMDVSLTALRADPWLHWTYTPEQWQRWSAVQVERLAVTPPTFVPRRDWRKFALVMAAICAGVFLFSPGGWQWKTAYILFLLIVFIGLFIAGRRGDRAAPAKLRARPNAAEPETFFGYDGVWANGIYSTWRGDIFLNSATVDDRAPRSLAFLFERDVPNPYGPLNIVHTNQAVLIPPGRESDLATLQQHLTDRCPAAQITLT